MDYEELLRSALVEIPESDLQRLKSYRDEYGLLPHLMFDLTQEIIPPSLTPQLIAAWLNGKQKNVDHVSLEFVLRQCREMVLFGAVKPL